MEIRRSLRVPSSAERLFAWVEDLGLYPQWMPLVHDVEPDTTQDGPAHDGTQRGQPAWNVELQAQVGPFARSKRLRMIRDVHRPPFEVVFRRAETDGRAHSPWVLRVLVDPSGGADESSTALTMELHYGGGLWTGAVLERVLDDEVRKGSEALIDIVRSEPTR